MGNCQGFEGQLPADAWVCYNVFRRSNGRAGKSAMEQAGKTAFYHLPGLFEFYELYRVFLPLFRQHREYFYDWCEIGSIYGAPGDCLWGGGRVGCGDCAPRDALRLTREYGVSARLTFSNSLLREEHLSDRKCNELCRLFAEAGGPANGVIVHSELAAALSGKTLSGAVFRLLHHKGADGVSAAAAGAGTGGIPLCGVGFSAEQGV